MRVYVPNSYVQRLLCPVCARTLAQPKNMPRDPIGWLAAQVRGETAGLGQSLDTARRYSRDAT
jgi:hypothetical protein